MALCDDLEGRDCGQREAREREREHQGQQTSNALLSPESITWTSRARTNTQGPDPEKGRRGGLMLQK